MADKVAKKAGAVVAGYRKKLDARHDALEELKAARPDVQRLAEGRAAAVTGRQGADDGAVPASGAVREDAGAGCGEAKGREAVAGSDRLTDRSPASHAFAGVDVRFLRLVDRDWSFSGRLEQQAPRGDWRTWLVMGGRGSGKTRAGAEWVHAMASAAVEPLRIALVAETLADGREVMVDGCSGLWRIARDRRPVFEISRRRLVWPNGSVAQLFSSEDPESLRGPQFDLAWEYAPLSLRTLLTPLQSIERRRHTAVWRLIPSSNIPGGAGGLAPRVGGSGRGGQAKGQDQCYATPKSGAGRFIVNVIPSRSSASLPVPCLTTSIKINEPQGFYEITQTLRPV